MDRQEPIRICLADDHAMFREGMISLLDNVPDIKVVGECGDGLSVPELIDKAQPDVLVLDVTMPGLNGLDACRQIRARCKQVRILVLTMHSNEQCVVDAMDNGASGYLLKDAAGEEFVSAIRAVAQGQVWLSSAISPEVLTRVNQPSSDPYKALTMRERQVLQMIAEGQSNRQIARMLGVSAKTIDGHRTRLMQKLDIHCQTELVKFALRRGIISLG